MSTLAHVIAVSTLLCIASADVLAQGRPGATAKVTVGTVERADRTRLDSNAPGGAVVGGTLGLLSGSGKSGGKKARNVIVGAAAGSAIASSAQGSREGTVYTVRASAGSSIRIVTDQTGIMVGDCVAVEETGGTANIRRLAASTCEAASQPAVRALDEEFQREASACAAAKDQLVEAATKEAAELASRKIGILCND